MERKWWHNQTVYQVYPRSFNDTTGNGIGDLNGITEKLDYLQELGIGIIWISPFYKSPMVDNGYDISDYYAIDPLFGTMEDFDNLVAEAQKRNIRIMIDLVVNHTSDQHPWFIESRSSLDNPKRDWYIWKKPKADGSAPNNWESHFTRSAWTLDETTGEYYLHLFSKEQPDLNWSNPEVREAVYEMMHFWLKKGLAGFRMDTINMLGKPSDYRDAVIKKAQAKEPLGWEFWANNSRVHEYLREMNDKVLSHYDIVNVGETPHTTPLEGMFYSHPDRHELSMIFQFEHMGLQGSPLHGIKDLDLPKFKAITTKWQQGLHGNGWNSNYWSNHDQPRAVSRFGNDGEYRIESAKMLAATLHLLSGTPYVYQGEEAALTNTYYESIDDYNDLMDHHFYDLLINDQKISNDEAMKQLRFFSRDNARVPMRWNSEENAGFTKGQPWLTMPDNYQALNAEAAHNDKDSSFWFYRDVIALRKSSKYSETITYGAYRLLEPDHPQLWAYQRYDDTNTITVLSNFSGEPCDVNMDLTGAEVLLSNYGRGNDDINGITLKPYETLVLAK